MPSKALCCLALAGLSLAGCGGPISSTPPPQCGLNGGGADSAGASIALPPSADPVFLVGAEAIVTFDGSDTFGTGCQGEQIFREARVKLFDPKNDELTPTVEVFRPGSGQVQVQVKFTPQQPGWYHVTAVLDFGSRTPLLQKEVMATVRRLDAPMVELSAACATLERTQAGSLLCDHQVFRAGTAVQSLPLGTQVAVAGNAVWTYSNGTLNRYVDSGAGTLTPTPASGLSTGQTDVVQLLAREDELFVIARFNVGWYQLQGGALTKVASLALTSQETPYPTVNTRALAVRIADRLHLALPGVSGNNFQLLSLVLGTNTLGRAATATVLPGQVVGVNTGGFFVAEAQQVRYLTPSPTGAPEVKARSALPNGYEFAFQPGNTTQAALNVTEQLKQFNQPLNDAPWSLPKVAGGDIVFEQFESSKDWQFLGANAHLTWERTKSVPIRTRVFDR